MAMWVRDLKEWAEMEDLKAPGSKWTARVNLVAVASGRRAGKGPVSPWLHGACTPPGIWVTVRDICLPLGCGVQAWLTLGLSRNC